MASDVLATPAKRMPLATHGQNRLAYGPTFESAMAALFGGAALICRSRTSAFGEAVCGAAKGEATHNAPNNTKALFMARTIAQNARSVFGGGTSGINAE